MPEYVNGEEIIAFIKTEKGKNLTEEEVKKFCKRRLATIKIPKYIVFVEEYQMTQTGKVNRNHLKQIALKMSEEVNAGSNRCKCEKE